MDAPVEVLPPPLTRSRIEETPNPLPFLLTDRDAAKLVGVSSEKLRTMRYQGTGPAFVPHVHRPRVARYLAVDVLDWLAARPRIVRPRRRRPPHAAASSSQHDPPNPMKSHSQGGGSLFGVHPDHGTLRLEACGALMVHGRKATGVEATRVLLGNLSADRNKPGQAFGPPVWEYAARRR